MPTRLVPFTVAFIFKAYFTHSVSLDHPCRLLSSKLFHCRIDGLTSGNMNNDQKQFQNLRDWILASGAEIQDITISSSPEEETYRWLEATENVKSGNLLIRLPSTHLITTKTARNATFVNDILRKAEEDGLDARLPNATEDSAAVMLFLLAELSKGNASFWHPWLQSLPKYFATPLLIEADRVDDMLDGTPVLPFVQILRSELRELYDDWFVPYALNKYPKVFDANLCTYNFFLYTHAVFESRAFTIDGVTVLAPFADMANHAPRESSACNARVRGWVMEDNPEALGLELYAGDRDIDVGDEIRICYGSLTNWELLVHFGFVDKTPNPDDSVVVQLEAGEDDDPKEEMRRLLILQIIFGKSVFAFPLTLDDPLPKDLVKCARILLLEGSEMDGGIRTDYNEIVSQRNERAVVVRLRDIIDGIFVENHEEDADMDESMDLEDDRHAKQLQVYCRRYIASITEILQRARATIDALENGIDKKEEIQ